MKVHFIGTCSGTRPKEGMHHCALTFEIDGRYYWFDAGENCSYFAHTNGIDLLNVKAIFISHMHTDHTGGLANLLWTIRKLVVSKKVPYPFGVLPVYVPDLKLFRYIRKVAFAYRKEKTPALRTKGHKIREGLIYKDDKVRISAIHSRHLGESGIFGWHAFGFLIEAEGKRIVYSGDQKTPEDLNKFIDAGCDYFIMETGHHWCQGVCEYAKNHGVKVLRFNHHGRDVFRNREECEEKIKNYDFDIKICYDGMTEEI